MPRFLVVLALCGACSGVTPARQKFDNEPQDACFVDHNPRCADMLVCTTQITTMGKTFVCEELDLNRNGRVDCLDAAEAHACQPMKLPRYLLESQLKR